MSKGWYGFDLDGTIAFYDGWKGETHIGEPIPSMIVKIKELLSLGADVRIFTARVAEAETNKDGSGHDILAVIEAIENWCEKHIGQKLPITNKKDFGMIELWDDRCVQIIPNTGIRADSVSKDPLEVLGFKF